MGVRINMENKLDAIDSRLKLVEDALQELVQTKVHHVDLHESTKEMLEVEPDETFTPPVKIKKTTKKVKTDKVGA